MLIGAILSHQIRAANARNPPVPKTSQTTLQVQNTPVPRPWFPCFFVSSSPYNRWPVSRWRSSQSPATPAAHPCAFCAQRLIHQPDFEAETASSSSSSIVLLHRLFFTVGRPKHESSLGHAPVPGARDSRCLFLLLSALPVLAGFPPVRLASTSADLKLDIVAGSGRPPVCFHLLGIPFSFRCFASSPPLDVGSDVIIYILYFTATTARFSTRSTFPQPNSHRDRIFWPQEPNHNACLARHERNHILAEYGRPSTGSSEAARGRSRCAQLLRKQCAQPTQSLTPGYVGRSREPERVL